MMERRTFLVMISGGLLAAPLVGEGQQGDPRIISRGDSGDNDS